MRFEDLEVWKRAARLSANLYKELRELKDYGLKIPAASCRESPTVRKFAIFRYAR